MTSRSPHAFVLYAGHNGLGMIRSLARERVSVTVVDCNPVAPALFSRYCDHLLAPDPEREPGRLVDSLIRAARRFSYRPVLLTNSDAYVLFVSRNRNALGPHFRFALPPAEVLEAIVNKRQQYQLAERVGTPYPAILDLSDTNVARSANERLFPAFIKPIYSHLPGHAIKRKGVVVRTPAELAENMGKILPSGVEVLAQNIIPGKDNDVYQVLAWLDVAHQPLGVFTFRKLRQFPPEFGVGTLVESVHDEQLARLGTSFLTRINYRGFASVEFKRDARDGQLKLIEVNARLSQQSSLPSRCGLNLPYLGYLDLIGQEPTRQSCFKPGVRWLDLSDDARAAWAYMRRGELGLVRWLSQVVRARAFAYWDWRDPLPFFVAYLTFVLRFLLNGCPTPKVRSGAIHPGRAMSNLRRATETPQS